MPSCFRKAQSWMVRVLYGVLGPQLKPSPLLFSSHTLSFIVIHHCVRLVVFMISKPHLGKRRTRACMYLYYKSTWPKSYDIAHRTWQIINQGIPPSTKNMEEYNTNYIHVPPCPYNTPISLSLVTLDRPPFKSSPYIFSSQTLSYSYVRSILGCIYPHSTCIKRGPLQHFFTGAQYRDRLTRL